MEPEIVVNDGSAELVFKTEIRRVRVQQHSPGTTFIPAQKATEYNLDQDQLDLLNRVIETLTANGMKVRW